ncbi:MAG: zf-HC2 domain-containing protein, partial [Phycisphaerales bacterium]|nr:zf-HC2 domain-containing protein [Phycisphaerales bacterium]
MTCKELAEFLMDYLDGELPAETRAVFDRHLG